MFSKAFLIIKNITTAFLEKILPGPLYFCSSRKLSADLSEQNARNNLRQPQITAPVHDQKAPCVQPLRCGRYSASYNGCASIALFNALFLRNCFQPLPSLIRQLECSGCLSFSGRFGTNPYRLNRVLESLPVKSVRFKKLDALEAALVPGDTAIIVIWNDRQDLRKGAHFFTVQRQQEGYTVYNRLAEISDTLSLSSIIGNGNFITGYRIC